MSSVIWRKKHADRNVTLGVDANKEEACETCSETARNDVSYSSVTVIPTTEARNDLTYSPVTVKTKTEARNEVIYSSVTVKPKIKFSPVLAEDQVIYSSVHK
nr:uncharacterized protein LOC101884314 [Danio rerio]|eukprot:XP_021322187.1 uncharacterized protein LOC101884314 [Danio rerio]